MPRGVISHNNRSKRTNSNELQSEPGANQYRNINDDDGLTDEQVRRPFAYIITIFNHITAVFHNLLKSVQEEFIQLCRPIGYINTTYLFIHLLFSEEASRDQKVNDEVFEKLEETLESADQSYRKVGAAGKELAADADVLLSMTKLLVNRMHSFKNEKTERVFSYREFAEKVVGFVRIKTQSNRIEGISDATASNSLLLQTIPADKDDEEPNFPSRKYLGKNSDPIPTQQKPKKERILRRKNDKEKAIFLKNMQYTDNEVSASKELDVVRRCMRRVWKDNNTSYIPFYSFVIDPDDFSKTVQNMFYVSFLVKDGQARLELGDDELPQLVKVTSGERVALHVDDRSAVTTNQAIIGFNYDIWEAMVAALDIKFPAIFSAD
uniref:Non-structural maintenance of chromosomes element 4 n=1 Tax=Heterorhabditis bacteriophora TaxID=37862 RepID=A0A1I7XRG5_HETBA